MTNQGGRPSKLTDELLATLEKTGDNHWTINDACNRLGITDTTWRKWKAQGEIDQEAGDDESKFVRFLTLATRVGRPRIRTEASGVLRRIMMDPEAKNSDRIAAAAVILRLLTAQQVDVEHTGSVGIQAEKITEALKAYDSVIAALAGDG